MLPPKRNTGPNALRRGRLSVPNANYFVTANLDPRRPVFIPDAARALMTSAHRLHSDKIWHLRCLTVMPDHVHLFFTLGMRFPLSRTLARLKHDTAPALSSVGTKWQENFYDHRLRAGESAEPVIRYIWLNSYRGQLIAAREVWPFFYCCPEDWEWFVGLTDKGRPDPGWLR